MLKSEIGRITMKQTTINKVERIFDNPFQAVDKVTYTREGISNQWLKTKSHNTVHILVKNIDTNELLLVKQTRIPVLVEQPETHGVTYEATAGIIDCFEDFSDYPQQQATLVAREEIREELGYEVHLEELVVLPKYIGSAGGSGSTCYPFYCEVTNDQFVGQHLGEDEDIEVFSIQPHKLQAFLKNTTNIDATTRYLLYWYLVTLK